MQTFIDRLRKQKTLQNLLLISLLFLIFILPQPNGFTDLAYVVILFLIVYLSSYLQIVPFWKGLLYSLVVTLIVVLAALTLIFAFPHIPFLLLMILLFSIAGLSVYFIG